MKLFPLNFETIFPASLSEKPAMNVLSKIVKKLKITFLQVIVLSLGHKLSGSRGLNLCLFLMRGSYLTSVVNELSGNEVGSELELVEHLTTERVGLGVAGNRSATCGELHNGLVIIGLVVDGLGRATCGSDHLLSHLTFGIVIILDGIDNHLGGYNLA